MNGTMYGMGSLGSGVDDAGGRGMNAQTITKDPKLLTKSTINNDSPYHQHALQYGGQHGVQHSASFGPGGGPPGAGGQALGQGPGMD